jgi:hypothetical protein
MAMAAYLSILMSPTHSNRQQAGSYRFALTIKKPAEAGFFYERRIKRFSDCRGSAQYRVLPCNRRRPR